MAYAIQRKGDDIFLVIKLPPGGNRPEGVPKYLKKSLEALQLDYVDLYLIHMPCALRDVDYNIFPFKDDGKVYLDMNNDHVATWKALEHQVDLSLTKSIGLSNFNISQIKRILQNARIPPSNLQIELHAYLQQNEVVEFCNKHDIVVTSYSTLGNPSYPEFVKKFGKKLEIPIIMKDPVVNNIAEKHKKTPAQILLKHMIQKGIVVIPKSINPQRVRENIDLFDFELDKKDMADLNGLDRGLRFIDFTLFKGMEEHPEYPI